MKKISVVLLIICGLTLINSNVFANEKIIVNISEFEPMVMKNENGYTGFDIELWDAIAKELNLEYEFKNTDWDDMFNEISAGDVPVGIAGITITSEREAQAAQPTRSSPHRTISRSRSQAGA